MGVLDGPMGALAQTMIGQFGRPAIIRRAGESRFDTSNLRVTTGDWDVHCSVVMTDFAESEVDGTLIQRGDRKAMVSRLKIGFEPVPNSDRLVEGGRVWTIVGPVKGFSSGEKEAAYELQVRR